MQRRESLQTAQRESISLALPGSWLGLCLTPANGPRKTNLTTPLRPDLLTATLSSLSQPRSSARRAQRLTETLLLA